MQLHALSAWKWTAERVFVRFFVGDSIEERLNKNDDAKTGVRLVPELWTCFMESLARSLKTPTRFRHSAEKALFGQSLTGIPPRSLPPSVEPTKVNYFLRTIINLDTSVTTMTHAIIFIFPQIPSGFMLSPLFNGACEWLTRTNAKPIRNESKYWIEKSLII